MITPLHLAMARAFTEWRRQSGLPYDEAWSFWQRGTHMTPAETDAVRRIAWTTALARGEVVSTDIVQDWSDAA